MLILFATFLFHLHLKTIIGDKHKIKLNFLKTCQGDEVLKILLEQVTR